MKHKRFTVLSGFSLRSASGAASEQGFTLIELLVTLSILAVFYGLVLANFTYWRGPQYVKGSANELATAFSRVRSYALSARSLDGNPVKLYVIQLNTNQSSYKIQGLESVTGGDVYKDPVETLYFQGATIVQDIALTSASGTVTHPACLQIAYSLPFGRVYMNSACDFNVTKTASALDALANQQLTVTLAKAGISTTKTVSLDGVSGRITIQ